MKNTPLFRLTLFAIVLLGVSVTGASPIEYLGFRLAEPTSVPGIVHGDRIKMTGEFSSARLILTIDKTGQVEEVSPEIVGESDFVNYLDDYLKSWQWKPAERNGVACTSKIMVATIFRSGRLFGDIIYPSQPKICDATSDLRFESFRLNGIEPPRLVEFPSLSLHVDKKDTSNFCAYAVLMLQLDSAGRVRSSRPVRTNAVGFMPKLTSALLWTEFQPARVDSQAVSSDILIALTFNRNLNYPTAVWKSCCLDRLNLLQRKSVALLLDTSLYLIPPIPQLPPGDTLDIGRGYKMTSDSILCKVRIKRSGKCIWAIQSQIRGRDARVVRALDSHLRLFPAIDSNGNPVEFEGYAYIHRIDSRKVRIVYSWLNGGRLSAAPDNSLQVN